MERKIRDNYFIGLTLPEDVSVKIEREREWMRNKWGNRSGMATEPHITLIPPFYSSLSVECLTSILEKVRSEKISVVVSGHSSFGERTIYAYVEESGEMKALLEKIKKELRKNDIRFKDERTFTPHITIANRDIKPYSFIPSMEYLNGIKLYEEFTLSSFTLFRFSDYHWHSISSFAFSS